MKLHHLLLAVATSLSITSCSPEQKTSAPTKDPLAFLSNARPADRGGELQITSARAGDQHDQHGIAPSGFIDAVLAFEGHLGSCRAGEQHHAQDVQSVQFV